MNRNQAMNYNALLNQVKAHGLTMAELDTLLRCERALWKVITLAALLKELLKR